MKPLPTESGAGVIAGYGKAFVVRIRRGPGRNVKPEAEQLDGKEFIFRHGWIITEEDSSLYVGEVAWCPNDFDWPADAPMWIASGDLEPSSAAGAAET